MGGRRHRRLDAGEARQNLGELGQLRAEHVRVAAQSVDLLGLSRDDSPLSVERPLLTL
jgi:hypothetical protein